MIIKLFVVLLIVLMLSYAIYELGVKPKKQKELLNEMGAEAMCNGEHIAGLPIAKGTNCEIIVYDDELLINGGGQSYSIKIDKITGAELKTDEEVVLLSKNSHEAKAIVGGLLFGAVGAIMGSIPSKTEKASIKRFYLIVNYVNANEDLDFVVMEATKDVNRMLVKYELQKRISVGNTQKIQL